MKKYFFLIFSIFSLVKFTSPYSYFQIDLFDRNNFHCKDTRNITSTPQITKSILILSSYWLPRIENIFTHIHDNFNKNWPQKCKYNITIDYLNIFESNYELIIELRKRIDRGDVYAVIGGESSNLAKLLVPVVKELNQVQFLDEDGDSPPGSDLTTKLFISPTASDPELSGKSKQDMSRGVIEATDTFIHRDSHFLRMHGSDKYQCQALIRSIRKINIHQIIIITSNTNYGKHGILSCKHQLIKHGVKISKIFYIDDYIDEPNYVWDYSIIPDSFRMLEVSTESEKSVLKLLPLVRELRDVAVHTILMHCENHFGVNLIKAINRNFEEEEELYK